LKNWTFCRRCHWQDEQPQAADLLDKPVKHLARLTVCPACSGNLAVMFFGRKEWMRHGADLLSGVKYVADFDPGHTPRRENK
jgi:predicted Rdx family selenoprotein